DLAHLRRAHACAIHQPGRPLPKASQPAAGSTQDSEGVHSKERVGAEDGGAGVHSYDSCRFAIAVAAVVRGPRPPRRGGGAGGGSPRAGGRLWRSASSRVAAFPLFGPSSALLMLCSAAVSGGRQLHGLESALCVHSPQNLLVVLADACPRDFRDDRPPLRQPP